MMRAKKKASPSLATGGLPLKVTNVPYYTNFSLTCKGETPPLLPYLPTFWLLFHLSGNGTEWIDAGLPIPNYLEHLNRGYIAGWQVDGFFGTEKGQEFLNDAIGRFLIAFRGEGVEAERLEYKPHIKRDLGHYMPKIYKLRELSRSLPSLPSRRHAPARADSFADFAFWAIKLWTEDEIRATGGPVVYERLEAWALSQFIDKERSTIRAKCRSVWNWYSERNWKLREGGKGMTRTEAAAKATETLTMTKKRKVWSLISGLFADDFKTKTGRWNIAKIAREAGVDRKTAAKYVREWEDATGGVLGSRSLNRTVEADQ
jgi:hypothetical protein